MNYSILYPDWFYSYLDIPNLEEIKKELINLLETGVERYEVNRLYCNFPSKNPLCAPLGLKIV